VDGGDARLILQARRLDPRPQLWAEPLRDPRAANIGGIVILGAYRLLTLSARIGAPRPFAIHPLRNSFHMLGQAPWTIGLMRLPLGTTFALEFTAPLWALVLAVPFLRANQRRPHRRRRARLRRRA
jgi:drug/metabolite transporter (DMT)-like permease